LVQNKDQKNLLFVTLIACALSACITINEAPESSPSVTTPLPTTSQPTPPKKIDGALIPNVTVTSDTWPTSDLVETTFPAVHAVDFGDQWFQAGGQSIAMFTVKGMTSSPVIALKNNMRHIAYDRQHDVYYTLQHSDIVKVDAQGQTTTIATLTDDGLLPAEGITFDSKRNRLIIGTFGGEGELIAFDLNTMSQRQLGSLNNLDIGALAYDEVNDRIFALPLIMVSASIDKIYVLEMQGAVRGTIALKKTITTYGNSGRAQLSWVAGALAVTINDPDSSSERVVLINSTTGDVYGQLSDLPFPPSKVDNGVCESGSSSNYSLASVLEPSLALLPAPPQQQLHVIGVYEGMGESSSGSNPPSQSIDVRVNPSKKPIVLFLSAYEPIAWSIHLAPDAVVQKVFVTGYYEPKVSGLSSTIPIERLQVTSCAYGWETNDNTGGCSYHKLIAQAREAAGLIETSFTGCYTGKNFVVP
jgi:hypothetical protein